MTSHTPAVDLSHDQPPLPNQHFSSWLRSHTTLFISQIVAVLGSVSLIASTIYYVSYNVAHASGHDEQLILLTVKLIVDCAHLVFIAVFILAMIRVLNDNERGSYRVRLVYERVFKKPKKGEKKIEDALEASKEQLRSFKRRFLWFWIGMLCLYVSFACQHTYEAGFKRRQPPPPKEVSLKFTGESRGKEEKFKGELSLNITDAAHAASPQNQAVDPKKIDRERVNMKLFFSFLAFFFNNFTLLFVFSCFLVMYIRPGEVKKERKYLVGSVVFVASLTILFLLSLILKQDQFTLSSAGLYISIFDALSGVINAVVLALLIARLDSKLVGLPSWLISILYSYAAVQPLFLVFELGDSSHLLQRIATLVLIFVFIFKIYFFLIIFYALQTGKMLNYLTCFPILRERADEHRKPAAKSASVLRRLVNFGRSAPHKLAKRYRTARWQHAHGPAGSGGTQPPRIKARLTTSRLLMSHRSLWVGEVFGWAAILYFFGFLILSQLIPGVAPSVVGAQNAVGVVHVGVAHSEVLASPEQSDRVVAITQLAVVFVIVVILLLVLRDGGDGRDVVAKTARSIFNEPLEHGRAIEEGEAQLKKFKRYFLYFWCATFLLYAVILLRYFPYLFDPERDFGSYPQGSVGHLVGLSFYPALEFVLASLNLVCAFWCFAVLQSPSFATPPSVTRQHSEMLRKHFEARQKRFEARQKLLVHYSGFLIFLLIAAFPFLLLMTEGPAVSKVELKDYATVFDGVTGMLSAVVLALLIARMDSKLFNLPSRLIWMLFTYASIQTLFIVFAQDDLILRMVRETVLATALGLKICFFLIVAHSLQSGKMLNYLVCFPLLKERVDSIFENQFEIRLARTEDGEFTFSILKKNQLHYSTARKFEGREECDAAIEELRGLMGERGSYGSPRHSSGTYWVEVRSAKGLLCESIPLRSAEEALDLIDESIGKVPHCKYNRL